MTRGAQNKHYSSSNNFLGFHVQECRSFFHEFQTLSLLVPNPLFLVQTLFIFGSKPSLFRFRTLTFSFPNPLFFRSLSFLGSKPPFFGFQEELDGIFRDQEEAWRYAITLKMLLKRMVDLKREMMAMVALMRDSRVKTEGQIVETNVGTALQIFIIVI